MNELLKDRVASENNNSGLPEIENQKQTIPYQNILINTNHYLLRKTTERPEPWGGTSGARYVSISNDLEGVKHDGHVSIDEALGIMEAVGGFGTIHTVIFEANTKQMHFYLAKPWQTLFESEKISYGFEELF